MFAPSAPPPLLSRLSSPPYVFLPLRHVKGEPVFAASQAGVRRLSGDFKVLERSRCGCVCITDVGVCITDVDICPRWREGV